MITISHQSYGDLKAISLEHPEQVRANTNTRIMLRPNDPETAEQFSNEMGTYRKLELTRQIAITGEVEGAEMGSQRPVDDFIVHPQQIKQLQVGQAYYKTLHDEGLAILQPIIYELNKVSLPDRENSEKEETKTDIEINNKQINSLEDL